MRLISLDLERYGPFTGRRLEFRPDARLHVVFGPNEAGKSSSLSAVTDLLFGVKRQTADDFLRPGKEMRLGASILARNGDELAFWRRKLKPLLSDGAGQPLPDDALAPFLGGLSRDVYLRAFGLDAEALRRSGEELKASDGELGAALFSAASGLRGIGAVRTALEREADGIFAERRSQNRLFYQASDRYEAARKVLRENETRAGDLKALREQAAEHQRRGAEITARRAVIAGERTGLDSLRRAAPILQALESEQARLAALGSLPPVPEGAGARLAEAVEKAAQAAAALQDARRQEERLRTELESIEIDQAVIAKASEIERLQTALGAYQKGLLDLPGLEREEEAAARQLDEAATRLGLPDRDALLAGRPDDPALAHLSELTAAGQRLLQTHQDRRAELARERAALDDRRRELGRHGAAVDPRPLRERLVALADLRRLAESVHEQAAVNAAEEAALAREGARLAPVVPDMGALSGASLPSRETVGSFAARLSALEGERRDAMRDREAAQSEAEQVAEKLDALAAGAPLPSQDRIQAARAERDRHWQGARAALFGEAVSASELAKTISAFETARAEADALADAAIRDAQRVAAHEDAEKALQRATALVARHASRLAETAERRGLLEVEWSALWQAAGIAPLSPSEMAGWLQSVAVLLRRHDDLLSRREHERALVVQIDLARPALAALLTELGLPAMPGVSVAAELTRAEGELDRIGREWEAARSAQTLLADLEARIAKAEADRAGREAEIARWQHEFRLALPVIGLADTATIAQVQASLAVWREVPALAAGRDRLQRRVTGIRRDGALFARDVAALAAECALQPGGAPEQALREIGRRLTATREAKARSEAMARRVAEAAAETAAAQEREDAARHGMAGLVAELELPPEADLARTGAALVRRDAAMQSMWRLRGDLANASDARDEADLRAALSDTDIGRIAADGERLAAEADRLEAEGREIFAAGRQVAARLDALGGTVEAEVALQQRRGAESDMVEAAREWAVLSIGAMMIGTAIARQRQSRQEPLMAAAGTYFATLTDGAFSGLGQTFDAEDVPHLVGLRAGGAELPVGAMSEGTRDQLYLALRLAYVEDYAAGAEPPPFLADDLFASFDDRRTVSGLRALARIGGAVQPILFTHHRFVADAARQALGDAVDVIDLG